MKEKEELVAYLSKKHIDNIVSLWGEVKSYYKFKDIEMGGGYASFGTDINVILSMGGKLYRFSVDLSEIQR
jgi:hypothetical protein